MKDEPLESRGSLPLDGTPELLGEEQAEKLAWVLEHYVHGRVQPEHQDEYARRYANKVFERFPGVRGLLVSDFVEEPEKLAEMVSEQGGHEHIYRLVDALFESRPDLRQRFVGRWMDELAEEITRRAPSTESHGIVTLLQEIETDWSNQS